MNIAGLLTLLCRSRKCTRCSKCHANKQKWRRSH